MLDEKLVKKAEKLAKPWEKFDLMDEYRKNIPEEEQKRIFIEISDQLREYDVKQKKEKRKKIFDKHIKKNPILIINFFVVILCTEDVSFSNKSKK